MTPEQMRELADAGSEYAGLDEYPGAVLIRDLSDALRAAADQLEAVRRIGVHVAREYEDDPALDAMLADLTARGRMWA